MAQERGAFKVNRKETPSGGGFMPPIGKQIRDRGAAIAG
jgi:hypothetical protein